MNIIKLIKDFFERIKEKRKFKKRLEELKKRDPFRYDH